MKRKGINVLSLFDGMGCGRIALKRLDIPVNFYFACEIDQFAKKVTYAKCPEILHKGSVTDLSAYDLPKIDIIMGGSPCQGFSFAGKGLNFDDPRSKLFFEYVRLLKECRAVNPDVLFLLENVRMKKEHEDVISRVLEVQPININSSLVSAQNRERLYWTNIASGKRGLFDDNYCSIPQPKDKLIFLRDILQNDVDKKYYLSDKAIARINRKGYSQPKINPDKTGSLNTKNNSPQLSIDSGTTLIISDRGQSGAYIATEGKTGALKSHTGCSHDHFIMQSDGVLNNNGNLVMVDKSNCIDANYHKGMDNHSQRTMVIHSLDHRKVIQLNENAEYGSQPRQQNRVYDINGLSPSVCCGNGTNSGMAKIMQGSRIRRLTPIEVCRLQTVPDDYFFDNVGGQIVSDSQIYKMIGNGWTVDVIVYILSFAKFIS